MWVVSLWGVYLSVSHNKRLFVMVATIVSQCLSQAEGFPDNWSVLNVAPHLQRSSGRRQPGSRESAPAAVSAPRHHSAQTRVWWEHIGRPDEEVQAPGGRGEREGRRRNSYETGGSLKLMLLFRKHWLHHLTCNVNWCTLHTHAKIFWPFHVFRHFDPQRVSAATSAAFTSA